MIFNIQQQIQVIYFEYYTYARCVIPGVLCSALNTAGNKLSSNPGVCENSPWSFHINQYVLIMWENEANVAMISK